MTSFHRLLIGCLTCFFALFPFIWQVQSRQFLKEKQAYLNTDFYYLRGFIKSVEKTRRDLHKLGAKQISYYHFTDHIYIEQGKKPDFSSGYLRIREYHPPTSFKHQVEMCRQMVTEGGIPLKERTHFSSYKKARKALVKGEKEIFSFERYGWQYNLKGHLVFVEDIDGLGPSVEVMSPTYSSLKKKLAELKAEKITEDSTPLIYSKKYFI